MPPTGKRNESVRLRVQSDSSDDDVIMRLPIDIFLC